MSTLWGFTNGVLLRQGVHGLGFRKVGIVHDLGTYPKMGCPEFGDVCLTLPKPVSIFLGIVYICTTNKSTYSPKDDWQFVNYLDTGNITANKIDDIQHIDIKTEKLPSRAKRKVIFMHQMVKNQKLNKPSSII